MPKEPITIADQLRNAIAKAEAEGMSRYRLAQVSGVNAGMLARYVTGERAPSLATAEKIAHALGYQLRLIKKV